MENNNVIDISDRDEFMGRFVEKDAVQLVEIGDSGKNYCLTLTKNALIAIREGKSFPLEVLDGDKKKTIVVMRDTTFRNRMKIHNKLTDQAKETAMNHVKTEQELNQLGDDIGGKIEI